MKYGYVNAAFASKINWAALITSLVGAASALGLIPEENREAILEGVLMAGGPLIMVFRSFFTVKEN